MKEGKKEMKQKYNEGRICFLNARILVTEKLEGERERERGKREDVTRMLFFQSLTD